MMLMWELAMEPMDAFCHKNFGEHRTMTRYPMRPKQLVLGTPGYLHLVCVSLLGHNFAWHRAQDNVEGK